MEQQIVGMRGQKKFFNEISYCTYSKGNDAEGENRWHEKEQFTKVKSLRVWKEVESIYKEGDTGLRTKDSAFTKEERIAYERQAG